MAKRFKCIQEMTPEGFLYSVYDTEKQEKVEGHSSLYNRLPVHFMVEELNKASENE